MKETQPTMRRRTVVRGTVAGAVTVVAPSFVDVAVGETDSGNVELTSTSTVPMDTSVDVTILEDENDDGTADRQQTESIQGGTDEITEFGALLGGEAQGYHYWMDVTLMTNDDSVTPGVDAATITLPQEESTPTQTPASGPEDPQSATELWNNYRAFVAGIVMAFVAIGAWGRSLALGAFLGYLAFAYIAVTTGTPLFESILYVTLVLSFVGFAFKLWRLEFGGE